MPRKNHALIVAIMDRSGSMTSMASEAMGGFNSFLEDQKKEDGTADMSVVLFDYQYEVVEDWVGLQDVKALTADTYQPRGTTALFDAVGRTIDSVGKKLADLPEETRPERVLFCIVTDGLENASSDYDKAKIKDMITRQQDDYDWAFMFLAADQDAFAAGSGIGVRAANIGNYANTPGGNKAMFASVSRSVSNYRKTGDATIQK